MKKISKPAGVFEACFTPLLLGVLSASSAMGASLQQASITEAVNSVSYQTDENAPQKPATQGTVIHSDNVVRTGIQSRAELKFNDDTITRMGANSVFTFDSKSQKLNLEEGSMLFSKPKEASTFEISTPAATCAISGTSGFLEFLPAVQHSKQFFFIMGLLEGHTTITIKGIAYNLGSGSLLVITPNGAVHLLNFDIPVFVKKAGLITHFKSTLPNQKEIDAAIKVFIALEHRGFITPFTKEYTLVYYDGKWWVKDKDGYLEFVSQIEFFEHLFQDLKPPGKKKEVCDWDGCGEGDTFKESIAGHHHHDHVDHPDLALPTHTK